MVARGGQKLDWDQSIALGIVLSRHREYKDAKKELRWKLQKELDKQLRQYYVAVEDAVVEANRLGVPKTRIASYGMSTSSANEVYRILDARGER